MSATNKKQRVINLHKPLTLTDLAEFFWKSIPEDFKEEGIDVLKARLCRAINERLCYYCLDGKSGKLTSVIFGYECQDDGIFVEGFVGRRQDIPYIYLQFRKQWPKVQYLSGYRRKKARIVVFTTQFLERKLINYGRR